VPDCPLLEVDDIGRGAAEEVVDPGVTLDGGHELLLFRLFVTLTIIKR
jgi:hypothetical protein